MYFRFASGLLLALLVSMAGVWLEKQTLELRRQISVQYYQTDVLLELLVRLRLESQQLTAPASHLSHHAARDTESARKQRIAVPLEEQQEPRLPLLRLREPFHPEGID